MHNNLNDLPVWKKLKKHACEMQSQDYHLKHLIKETGRLKKFSLDNSHGFFFDFSRQRVNKKTMDLLFELAEIRKLNDKFKSMVSGSLVNRTENRAALHTATRHFTNKPVFVNKTDIMPEIRKTRVQIRDFSKQIHLANITGSTGKAFKHIVVIGIGGSYLGTEFTANALYQYADKGIKLHFLSNVDVDNFGKIVSEIDPETTLWIIISKSYTTAETDANAALAYDFMQKKNLNPKKHFVIVTGKGSPGDKKADSVLAIFHMFDFIGGRYSVSSAVGGVPLSIYLGYDRYEQFLKGAHEMDSHGENSSVEANIPLIAALISIWNNNFLGYSTQAIIPYSALLSKLAPHVQQLYMESTGKSVNMQGDFLNEKTGVIVFGEPGTNAQHSFFQLAHQGRPFPVDFIIAINPQFQENNKILSKVSNHQELWANCIAQAMALAKGADNEENARFFPGNRPSTTIVLDNLAPENIGTLLSFYEAKTVFESFIWDINPFDQFGVELGKSLTSKIRDEIVEKNINKNYLFESSNKYESFYLKKLFSK